MKIKFGILSLIAGIILASCSTGNDVVSGRGIQKRKYNDGYYVSWNKNNKDKNGNQDVVIYHAETNQKSSAQNSNTYENIKPLSLIENTEEETFVLDQKQSISFNEESNSYVKTERIISHPLSERTPKMSFKPGRIIKPLPYVNMNENSAASSGGIMLVLLVVLCLIGLPWIAVLVFEGATNRFWIDLILWLIGVAIFGWLLSGIAGLALLVSVIYGLLIVLSVI